MPSVNTVSLQPQNMFQVEEVNCICVDWKRGSQTTYTQAASNVRVVGAQVAQMIDILSVSRLASGWSTKLNLAVMKEVDTTLVASEWVRRCQLTLSGGILLSSPIYS